MGVCFANFLYGMDIAKLADTSSDTLGVSFIACLYGYVEMEGVNKRIEMDVVNLIFNHTYTQQVSCQLCYLSCYNIPQKQGFVKRFFGKVIHRLFAGRCRRRATTPLKGKVARGLFSGIYFRLFSNNYHFVFRGSPQLGEP